MMTAMNSIKTTGAEGGYRELLVARSVPTTRGRARHESHS